MIESTEKSDSLEKCETIVESIKISLANLENFLESSRDCTNSILDALTLLRSEIEGHHSKVLKAKTGGTTVTTVGTGLAVTGLIMAPFTLGASLIVTSVGAVSSVCGAGVGMITDLVDHRKRKVYMETIQSLSTSHQEGKEGLAQLLGEVETTLSHLMDPPLSLSKREGLHALLITGDRPNLNDDTSDPLKPSPADDEDFEIVDHPQNWQPVRKFAFTASIHSLKIVKNSQILTTLARSTSSTASNITLNVGRIIGHTAFKTTMAAVGVVFTSLDIALLIREWKKKDPTMETVDFVMGELTEELEKLEELGDVLRDLKATKLLRTKVSSKLQVIASSVFALRAVTGLLTGDKGVATTLYGVESKTLKNCGALEIETLTECEETKTGGFETELISDLKQIIPEVLDDCNSGGLRRVPVIDGDILTLNSRIIEGYITTNHIKDPETIKTLRTNSIYPLPPSVVYNIQNVLISYVKGPSFKYVNANKWELDLILGKIVDVAIRIMELQNGESETADLEILSEEVADLVEILISHKSYVDPLGGLVWTNGNNEKNEEMLKEVEGAIEGYLRGLRHTFLVTWT